MNNKPLPYHENLVDPATGKISPTSAWAKLLSGAVNPTTGVGAGISEAQLTAAVQKAVHANRGSSNASTNTNMAKVAVTGKHSDLVDAGTMTHLQLETSITNLESGLSLKVTKTTTLNSVDLSGSRLITLPLLLADGVTTVELPITISPVPDPVIEPDPYTP